MSISINAVCINANDGSQTLRSLYTENASESSINLNFSKKALVDETSLGSVLSDIE